LDWSPGTIPTSGRAVRRARSWSTTYRLTTPATCSSARGGALTPSQLVGRIVSLVIGLGLVAWAISQGNVTVWHLLVPMVGQYVTLIVVLPLLYLALRHPGLRKDGLASLRLWGIFAMIAVAALVVGAYRQGEPWQRLLVSTASAGWQWVTEAHMQWPLLWSVVEALLAELPQRFDKILPAAIFGEVFLT
jgi:hypothetical protein